MVAVVQHGLGQGPLAFAIPTDPGVLVDTASGLLLVALGVAVALLRPRRTSNVLFGLFSGGWGLFRFLDNVIGDLSAVDFAFMVAGAVAALVGSIGLILLLLRHPLPLHATERRSFLGVAASALVLYALSVTLLVFPLGYGESLLVGRLMRAGFGTVFWAMLFGSLLLSFRYAHPRIADQPAAQRHAAMLAVALALEPAVRTGANLAAGANRGPLLLMGLMGVAWFAFTTFIWIRNTWRCHGAAASRARDVTLVIAALPFLGLLLGANIPNAHDSGLLGAVRVLTAVVFAYGIVRHQLLGIDVKVRWTISRTTVAAMFVAVFFVVSEGAQEVFAVGTGRTWMGILAAGALVFAIAPLQRLGDRLADRAVPGARPLAALTAEERMRIYEEQCRVAWSDGKIDAGERLLLMRLREQLGLAPDAADDAERAALVVSSSGQP